MKSDNALSSLLTLCRQPALCKQAILEDSLGTSASAQPVDVTE